MQFEENEDWDKHISSFCNIVDKLASLNQAISDTGMVTKLFRTLPASFGALAMASSLSTSSFEEIVNAVSANIERKKKLGTWKHENKSLSAHFANSLSLQRSGNNSKFNRISQRGRRKFGRTRGRFQRNFNDRKVCQYFGKPGHYIKFCPHQLADEHQISQAPRQPARNGSFWGSSALLDSNIDARSTPNEANDVNFVHTLPSNNRGQRSTSNPQFNAMAIVLMFGELTTNAFLQVV